MRRVASFFKSYPVVVVTLFVLAATLTLEFLAGMPTAARWVATVYVLAVAAWTTYDMVRNIIRGHFGLDVLALMAMLATVLVGEYVAGIIIVLMLTGGEALEQYAAARAKSDLDALLKRAPNVAFRLDPADPDAAPREIAIDEVNPGDLLLVKPAGILPTDGELLSDAAELDESSLTGESLPVFHTRGDTLYSGTGNGERAIRMRATATAADSQYQQIIQLVRDAEHQKAPTVRLADRYAVPFTVVSLAIATIAWWASGDPVRFAEVLVLATPCPLLIAAPVAFMGGMSRSAREGVIVKGGATLEALAKAKSVAFDKTGTLSHGNPELVDVVPEPGISERELLQLAASAEQYSTHVLADGIVAAARARGLDLDSANDAEEVATNGVTATVAGRQVRVGKLAFVRSLDPNASAPKLVAGQTSVAIAIDGRFAGSLILADALRENARATVAALRSRGLRDIRMVTGDNEHTAESLAHQAGIDTVHAALAPQDKVQIVTDMPQRPVIMVGDGVNDAPVLATAEVGIAMATKGSTAASESADAVIVRDDISLVVRAIDTGKHTYNVAITAIWIGIVLSVGLMLVAAFGHIPAVAGALTQELVDLATIVYALRARGSGKNGLRASSPVDATTTLKDAGASSR